MASARLTIHSRSFCSSKHSSFFVLFSHRSLSLFSPSRTHYRLSRIEILQGMANRFVHSTFYLYFYASMAVASLLTVFLSLFQDCPGSLFYGLELGINLVLIAEVGVRMGAFGKVSSLRRTRRRYQGILIPIDFFHYGLMFLLDSVSFFFLLSSLSNSGNLLSTL